MQAKKDALELPKAAIKLFFPCFSQKLMVKSWHWICCIILLDFCREHFNHIMLRFFSWIEALIGWLHQKMQTILTFPHIDTFFFEIVDRFFHQIVKTDFLFAHNFSKMCSLVWFGFFYRSPDKMTIWRITRKEWNGFSDCNYLFFSKRTCRNLNDRLHRWQHSNCGKPMEWGISFVTCIKKKQSLCEAAINWRWFYFCRWLSRYRQNTRSL